MIIGPLGNKQPDVSYTITAMSYETARNECSRGTRCNYRQTPCWRS